MLVFPYAKINLGLNITDKRTDGYHNISSVLFPIPLYDALEIIPAPRFEFISTGLEIPGADTDNLITQAWNYINNQFGTGPVKIHLHKLIPMGAGLGGGSSDAAFTILVLNRIFDLGLKKSEMHQMASELGADCPFFLYHQPMLASETGTSLKPFDIDLSGWHLQLILPEIHSNTREAYKMIKPAQPPKPLENILTLPPENWEDQLINDFESPLFKIHPELQEIKERLYENGAIYAAMSGSGSSIFGLYPTVPATIPNLAHKQFFFPLGELPGKPPV